MIYLNLKNRVFKKILIDINLQGEGEEHLQLDSKFNFHIKYAEDKKSFMATFTQEIKEKAEPPRINIEVVLVGVFFCGKLKEEEKQEAHVIAYHLLFGHMQSMIMHLCSDAGISPIVIEPVKMEPEDVQFEKNKN